MKHELAERKKDFTLSYKTQGVVIGGVVGGLIGGIPVLLWGALLGLIIGTLGDELSGR